MIPWSLVGPPRAWDCPRPGGLLLWQGPWLWMADPWALPLQGPCPAGLLLPREGAQRAGVRSISPCAQMREPRRRGCRGAVLRADGHPPATVTWLRRHGAGRQWLQGTPQDPNTHRNTASPAGTHTVPARGSPCVPSLGTPCRAV